MGLSRRRRAKTPTHRQPRHSSVAPAKASEAVGAPRTSPSHSDRSQSGKTQRKVSRKVAQEMKRCLVSFEVKQSLASADHQGGKENRGRIATNPNLNGTERVRLEDSYYNSQVAYSLNKKSRWDIEDQITNQYNSGDGDLCEDNLFVFGTEWRPQGRGRLVTRRLATNASHMRLAADKLRQQQRRKSSQKKADDELEFNDSVKLLQKERPLVRAVGRRNHINRGSFHRSFEMPECEAVVNSLALKIDFEQRNTVCIDIRRPEASIGSKVSHSRLVEQKHCRRRDQQCQRWTSRNGHGQQDYIDDPDEYLDDDELDSEDDMEMYLQPPPAATVFDFMRMPTATNRQQNYFETELHDEFINARQRAHTTEENQVCDIHPHFFAPERLEQLFAGTDALFMSNSQPRKFSVLLQDNLAELVSFDVISEGTDGCRATVEVQHSLIANDSGAKPFQLTSSAEIAARSDPCAFLRSLLTEGATPGQPVKALGNPLPAGWCHTAVWKEADARLAAIRSLPMFAATWKSASMKRTARPTANTESECGICCSEISLDIAIDISERSTELGVCGHRFCNACWVRHVACCLKAGSTRVECPANGCATVLDAAVLLWFCPQRLLPALVGAAFRAWQRSLPTSRFCPLPRCGRLLVAADDSGKNALCSCWTSFCLACGQEPHWPVDCETAEQYLTVLTATEKRPKREHRTRYFKTTVTGRICPGCKALVERLCGCDHMTCFCKQVFCWKCGNPKNVRAIHSCGRHASSLVQKSFSGRERVLKLPSSLSLHGKTRRARESVGRRLLESQARLAARLLSAAGRFVGNSDQTVAYALMSSYLLEYTCVLLDANEAGEKLQSMVHRIGETIQQALRSVHAEFQLGWSAVVGSGDAGRAGRICDKLDSLQRQLAVECERLRKIVDTFEEQNDEALNNASSQV